MHLNETVISQFYHWKHFFANVFKEAHFGHSLGHFSVYPSSPLRLIYNDKNVSDDALRLCGAIKSCHSYFHRLSWAITICDYVTTCLDNLGLCDKYKWSYRWSVASTFYNWKLETFLFKCVICTVKSYTLHRTFYVCLSSPLRLIYNDKNVALGDVTQKHFVECCQGK